MNCLIWHFRSSAPGQRAAVTSPEGGRPFLPLVGGGGEGVMQGAGRKEKATLLKDVFRQTFMAIFVHLQSI